MRPDWDKYFLGIARAVAARADCTRAQHGAVIVKDNRIVSTGYNAAPAGGPSCLAGECPRGRHFPVYAGSHDGGTYCGSCGPYSVEWPCESAEVSLSGYDNCISLHAEQNALLYADRSKVEGGTIYITGQPCSWCERLISGSGIVRTVF